jgi:hypothetical protein
VIVADDQLSNRATFEQYIAHELFGRQAREVTVEPHQQHIVQRRERQNLEALGARRQERRRRFRVYHFERVRVEGHQHAGSLGRPCSPIDLLEDRLVPQVHPVERSDRDGASVLEAGKRGRGAAGPFTHHEVSSTTVG